MKLKVTWQNGGWNRDGDQPIATALIPAEDLITAVVGETLVFRALGEGNGAAVNGAVLLIVPESRLISAVPVEAEEQANG